MDAGHNFRRRQFINRTENAALESMAGQVAEVSINIEPRGADGREMDVEPLVAREPRLHPWLLVRRVIVADQMNRFVERIDAKHDREARAHLVILDSWLLNSRCSRAKPKTACETKRRGLDARVNGDNSKAS
jgi:hypothetical protein